MRVFGLRLVRIFAVAVLAYLAIVGAGALGRPWIGWTLAVSVLSAYLGVSLLQAKKRSANQREGRWELALYDPGKRPKVLIELRKAVRQLEPVKQRTRQEHARLSVLLSELLDADGQHADAMGVIDAVSLTALPALDVALVRHTRAVTHLRSGDAAGALRGLQAREPCGDSELDQRLGLLECYARIELGDVQSSMQRVEAIAQQRGSHESVLTEARVVRAAGLDALGRREEALVAIAALGRESLISLAALGQPRVRTLAQQALDSVAD